MRSVFALVLLMSPVAVRGQEPKTIAGAYAAAVALVRSRADTRDSTRIVPDSATMYRDYVRCSDVATPQPGCALIGENMVIMVSVSLPSLETAAVSVKYYITLRGSCPLGTPFAASVVAATRVDSFSMTYADGRWKSSSGGRGMEC